MLFSTWILGLFSLVPTGGAIKLLWDARRRGRGRLARLAAGLALLAWAAGGGRWLVLRAFFRPGSPPPDPPGPVATRRLERPDGAELHVGAYGPAGAPVLLFTHGEGTTGSVWRYAAPHLTDRFRVVVWDRRGFGRSSPPSAPDYGTEAQARDLEAVLAAAAARPAILVGHSFGGMTLLTFCRLFPHHLGGRVAGLVLADTSAHSPYRHRWPAGLAGIVRAAEALVLAPALRLATRLSPLLRLGNALAYLNGSAHLATRVFGFGGGQTRGQLDLATGYLPLTSPGARARENLAMLGYDEQGTLGRITVPTLVITGNADRLIPPRISRRLAAGLPRADLLELRRAGHMTMLEQPLAFAAAVRDFADRVLGSGEADHPPASPSRAPRAARPLSG